MKSWCIGKPSAQYVAKIVAKMEDVLDVNARPYDAQRPVVCLDEVSKALHTTPHGTLAMTQGQAEREDYEYARQGVCNLFVAVEPLTGKRTVRVTDRRTALDFAEELRILVEESYPAAEKIVLVTNNSARTRRLASTRALRLRRHGALSPASSGITRRSMAVGSMSPSVNSRCWLVNVSSAASAVEPNSSAKSMPGRCNATADKSPLTGTSPAPRPASGSSASTQHSKNNVHPN